MIGKKRFWKSNKAGQIVFKKSQFATLMCVGLIAIVAFAMMDISLADPTETLYCDGEECHINDEPTTWITVTVDSQTADEITYYVTGSDVYDGEEGWGVFDPLQNNVANGIDSGYFTLPKDGQTYRVFWVDNETDLGPGSAYEDIITPNDPPSAPVITGETNGGAGTSYTYTFTSTDSNDDQVSYYIKWGDGEITDWTAFQASGTPYSESHTWSEGTYTIKAKARDIHGLEGAEGTLVVTMPVNYQISQQSSKLLFLRALVKSALEEPEVTSVVTMPVVNYQSSQQSSQQSSIPLFFQILQRLMNIR